MAGVGLGIAGVAGEGLNSFAQAYQQALNYQLQKQQAADLHEYQMQMGNAAAGNMASGQATAASELLKKGSPALQSLGKGLTTLGNMTPEQLGQTPASQPDQAQPIAQPVQADPSAQPPQQIQGPTGSGPAKGMVPQGPPASRLLNPAPQATPMGTTENLPPVMSDQDFALMEKGAAFNPKAPGGIDYAPGVLGNRAKVADATAAATLNNANNGGSRTASGASKERFVGSDEYKNASVGTKNLATANTFYNSGNGPALKDLYLKSMGTTAEEILGSTSASAQLKAAIAKTRAGDFTQEDIDRLYSPIAQSGQTAYQIFKQKMPIFQADANDAGVKNPSFLQTPQMDQPYAQSQKILSGIKQPNQQPKAPGLIDQFKSQFGIGQNNSVAGDAHPLTGKVLNYRGKNYNVDAQGNMTPVRVK